MMRATRKRQFAQLKLLAMLVAVPFLVAARYWIMPAGEMIMPDSSGHRIGEVFAVSKSGAVLLNRLTLIKGVHLVDSVRVETPGLSKSFSAGDRLFWVGIAATGGLVKGLPANTVYYCDPSPKAKSDSIFESSSVMQTGICFYDRDGDDILDGAFWGNSRKAEDQVIVPISKTRISVTPFVDFPRTSEIRFSYEGVSRPGGDWRFRLSYMICGQEMSFTDFGDGQGKFGNWTIASPKRGFPQDIAGGRVTLLGYDQSADVLKVRINRTIAPGPLGRDKLSLPPESCYL